MDHQNDWTPTDHDTLIELRTLLQQLIRDIRDLKDGTHAQLSDHDRRLHILENVSLQYPPATLTTKYDQTSLEWDAFKQRQAIYSRQLAASSIFLSGLVSAGIALITRYWLGRP